MKKIGKNSYISGVLKSDVVNKNGRTYPKEILQDVIRQFGELTHPVYGELGHSENSLITLSKISHNITDVFIAHDKIPRKKKKQLKKKGLYQTKLILYAKLKLSQTPSGKIASKIIKDLVIRPRGEGTLDKNGNVNSNYKIISFDLIQKKMMHLKVYYN